jgi:hypothetical protein
MRRVAGATLMLAGTGTLSGAAWAVTMLAAAGVEARAALLDIVLQSTGFAWLLGTGLTLLLVGRLVYGSWHEAAPIATVTGEIARTVGLIVAVSMAGLLIFLFASGMEHDDAPAAVALGLGVAGGILLAQLGANLRNSRERFPE